MLQFRSVSANLRSVPPVSGLSPQRRPATPLAFLRFRAGPQASRKRRDYTTLSRPRPSVGGAAGFHSPQTFFPARLGGDIRDPSECRPYRRTKQTAPPAKTIMTGGAAMKQDIVVSREESRSHECRRGIFRALFDLAPPQELAALIELADQNLLGIRLGRPIHHQEPALARRRY